MFVATTIAQTYNVVEPVVINPNPTIVVVNAVERDYLEADGGTGHSWDNQFWIVANRTLSAGETTIVEFDYVSSVDANTSTECHTAPSKYLHWDAIGNVYFTTEEHHFSTTFIVPSEADGMQSIAFNMAVIKEACDYTIKNIVWKLEDNTESLINQTGAENFYVKVGAGTEPHVYNPFINGDVNGDGALDVADITTIISIMADGKVENKADVNGDGFVDASDIASVITIIVDESLKPKPQLPPVAITGSCSNLTVNSATVSCTYENVPEDGVCGVKYSWDGGSAMQTTIGGNGTQMITLSGLKPGTTYTYCAYVETNGTTYYGSYKSFKTELPDITGTWYCTEWNSDGTVNETWTITLNTGGHGSAYNGSTYDDVGWGIDADGHVSIGIIIYMYSTGLNPYCIQDFYGTVDNLQNPTRIEGEGRKMTGNDIVENNQYTTFVMTR